MIAASCCVGHICMIGGGGGCVTANSVPGNALVSFVVQYMKNSEVYKMPINMMWGIYKCITSVHL